MEPKLFVATKAFITFQGKILILRESSKYKEGTGVGKYDVPGGRIKSGERFDKSLLREIKEETGLSVKIGQPFHTSEWRPVVNSEIWQVVGTFFQCQTDTNQVTLSKDHNQYLWIDPKDYKNYPLVGTNPQAFEDYLKIKSL